MLLDQQQSQLQHPQQVVPDTDQQQQQRTQITTAGPLPQVNPLEPTTNDSPTASQLAFEQETDPDLEAMEAELVQLRAEATLPGLSIGRRAELQTRIMKLDHDVSIRRTGDGKYHGSQGAKSDPSRTVAGEIWAAIQQGRRDEMVQLYGETLVADAETTRGKSRTKGIDCTTFVIEVLRSAFSSAGKKADFDQALRDAQAGSPKGLEGTELMEALVKNLKWYAVALLGDVQHNKDQKFINQQTTYYGDVPLGDRTENITNFGNYETPTTEATNQRIERLRRVPFGVLTHNGGSHMALLINGKSYECHWTNRSNDENLIEIKENALDFVASGDGVVVIPPEYVPIFKGTATAP